MNYHGNAPLSKISLKQLNLSENGYLLLFPVLFNNPCLPSLLFCKLLTF